MKINLSLVDVFSFQKSLKTIFEWLRKANVTVIDDTVELTPEDKKRNYFACNFLKLFKSFKSIFLIFGYYHY